VTSGGSYEQGNSLCVPLQRGISTLAQELPASQEWNVPWTPWQVYVVTTSLGRHLLTNSLPQSSYASKTMLQVARFSL